MMGEPRLGAPQMRLDAAGCHGAAIEQELMCDSLRQGMVDANQAFGWALTTEAQVSAGIDHEAGIAAQPVRRQVAGQALAAAAGVNPDAHGPGDRPGCMVHDDPGPRRIRLRRCRTAHWRRGQGVLDTRRRQPRTRGCVAGCLQLAHQRRVDKAIRSPRGPEGGVNRDGQCRTDFARQATVRVERAEVAARVESAEPAVQGPEEELDLNGHRLGRREARLGRLADQQTHVRAEQPEATIGLGEARLGGPGIHPQDPGVAA
jgi:hypothetical protein